jgi:uncharacterized Zn finger protein (UPF0148 family)
MKFCKHCGEEIYTRDGENSCPNGCKAQRKEARAAQRRARHEALTSCALVRVRGALGGVYYE